MPTLLLTEVQMGEMWQGVNPYREDSGGGPVQKIELLWEEMDDRLRLHAYCLFARWLMDPQRVRFSLYTPDGKGADFLWPEGITIQHLGLGHFAVDLQPTQVGVWQGRWDAWGAVNAIKTFAFEIGIREGTVNWKESTQHFGVMPVQPAVTL